MVYGRLCACGIGGGATQNTSRSEYTEETNLNRVSNDEYTLIFQKAEREGPRVLCNRPTN